MHFSLNVTFSSILCFDQGNRTHLLFMGWSFKRKHIICLILFPSNKPRSRLFHQPDWMKITWNRFSIKLLWICSRKKWLAFIMPRHWRFWNCLLLQQNQSYSVSMYIIILILCFGIEGSEKVQCITEREVKPKSIWNQIKWFPTMIIRVICKYSRYKNL